MNEAEALAAPIVVLKDAYRVAAASHGAATSRGRHRVANRCADELILLSRELRNRGVEGHKALQQLLDDEDLSVRVWAAAHSLPFAHDLAEKILEKVAAGPPSPVRLTAEMTLAEWRAGKLPTS